VCHHYHERREKSQRRQRVEFRLNWLIWHLRLSVPRSSHELSVISIGINPQSQVFMKKQKFPTWWDETRVKNPIAHYEQGRLMAFSQKIPKDDKFGLETRGLPDA